MKANEDAPEQAPEGVPEPRPSGGRPPAAPAGEASLDAEDAEVSAITEMSETTGVILETPSFFINDIKIYNYIYEVLKPKYFR